MVQRGLGGVCDSFVVATDLSRGTLGGFKPCLQGRPPPALSKTATDLTILTPFLGVVGTSNTFTNTLMKVT
jgi:hypothetical protein